MTEYSQALDAMAKILSYPGNDFQSRSSECAVALEAIGPSSEGILSHYEQFRTVTGTLSLAEMEELYTRTFDINPVSSLEVGWHLHGETYERGAFLVAMRDLLRRSKIEETSALPDHLTMVLQAVGRMHFHEAIPFISEKLLKALEKMLEGFVDEENPYKHLLVALRELLSHYALTHAGAHS
jgi:nitrate reductase molybdenum cofactor assembly chaperone NarJ/NarW